jgi:hypothetical protein
MITRPVSALPAGTAFGRFVKALGIARGNASAAAEYAEGYHDSPQVPAAFLAMVKRSAVPGMTSTTTELGTYGVFDASMALLLSAVSGFAAALPKMKAVPFNVGVPRQFDAGTAAGWVKSGEAIPAVSFFLDPIRHEPANIGAITVLSDEVLRSPNTEPLITSMLLGALARGLDSAFLDPASAGGDGVPASITNAAPSVVWSGSVAADLAELLPLVSTPGSALAWFGRPTTLAAVAAGLGGASDLPRSILGISVIAAPYAPVGQLALVDLGAILVSVGDPDLSVSEAAAIEMEDAPSGATATGSPVGPVPTSLVSLYQANCVGLRITRAVNWTAPTGCAAYIEVPIGSPA